MRPSKYSSLDFTISYYQRLSLGAEWLGDIKQSAQGWRHGISAFGGFENASFELVESQSVMDDWILNGLGRAIIVSDDTLSPMWEGFVNSITINQAGLSVTYGPLTDIANKVFAIYSGVDTSVYPPQIGVRKKTPTFQNLTSQQIWGIWPAILSLAGVTDTNSDQLVNMYLVEHAHAEKNSNFSFGQKDISLSVDCLGWYHSLHYPYNFTASSGDIAISTRIQQIISAQVNPWVSTDYSRILTNATTVPAYENDDQIAIEQLRGMAAMGDASNNRHLFGIYENRQVVYEMSSQEIDYTIKLSDPEQVILDKSGALVAPWRVRPGKWIMFSDFMPGLGSSDAFLGATAVERLHEDPRTLQIENIQFDIRVPFSIQLTGGHSSRYEQRSARLGLRGMDA